MGNSAFANTATFCCGTGAIHSSIANITKRQNAGICPRQAPKYGREGIRNIQCGLGMQRRRNGEKRESRQGKKNHMLLCSAAYQHSGNSQQQRQQMHMVYPAADSKNMQTTARSENMEMGTKAARPHRKQDGHQRKHHKNPRPKSDVFP
jgi:hypothetical protein